VYLHQRMYAALCALNHDLVLVTHVNCYIKQLFIVHWGKGILWLVSSLIVYLTDPCKRYTPDDSDDRHGS